MTDTAITVDAAPPILAPKEREPAAGRIPGNMAIWVGILSEMTEFAMMFIIYFIAKAHYPEFFNQGPLKLNTLAGTVNTLVLLSSSYFVAKAMRAIRQDNQDACARWLWMAIFAGCLYLIIKYFEYQ